MRKFGKQIRRRGYIPLVYKNNRSTTAASDARVNAVVLLHHPPAPHLERRVRRTPRGPRSPRPLHTVGDPTRWPANDREASAEAGLHLDQLRELLNALPRYGIQRCGGGGRVGGRGGTGIRNHMLDPDIHASKHIYYLDREVSANPARD